MRYVLIDTANMFFRARHGAFRASDTWEKIGFALHITLMAANKVARRFEADHVVFALEGRSWRKDVYAPYKRQRTEARAAHSPREAEEERVFWETFDQFKDYITNKTNCTVLQHQQLEADDLIATYAEKILKKGAKVTIVSSDKDLMQLYKKGVRIFDPMKNKFISEEDIFTKC